MLDQETAGASAPAAPLISYAGTHNHVPAAVTLANIEACHKRALPVLSLYREHGNTLTICGGAPSLAQYLDRISMAQTVAVVNGVNDYFAEHDVPFSICCLADSCPSVAGLFKPLPNVKYLVASHCAPEVFDKLAGFDVTIWHAWDGDRGENELFAKLWPGAFVHHGGPTGTSRLLNLGHTMGYRRFRIYGADSSFADENQRHAYPTDHDKTERIQVTATTRDTGDARKFETTRGLAAQAAAVHDLMRSTFFHCDIRVIGDGLLPFLSDEFNRQKAEWIAVNGPPKPADEDDTISAT